MMEEEPHHELNSSFVANTSGKGEGDPLVVKEGVNNSLPTKNPLTRILNFSKSAAKGFFKTIGNIGSKITSLVSKANPFKYTAVSSTEPPLTESPLTPEQNKEVSKVLNKTVEDNKQAQQQFATGQYNSPAEALAAQKRYQQEIKFNRIMKEDKIAAIKAGETVEDGSFVGKQAPQERPRNILSPQQQANQMTVNFEAHSVHTSAIAVEPNIVRTRTPAQQAGQGR